MNRKSGRKETVALSIDIKPEAKERLVELAQHYDTSMTKIVEALVIETHKQIFIETK